MAGSKIQVIAHQGTVFDVIVVGAGLFGSATAKHLAKKRINVALVGPDEPENKVSHVGVFGSHYDEGRITRQLDSKEDWARLSQNAIRRYSEIEQESGVDFFSEVGSLIVGPVPVEGNVDYMQRVLSVLANIPDKIVTMSGQELISRFDYFDFRDNFVGAYEEKKAGYISPRKLVKAQKISADKFGATLINSEAMAVTRNGNHWVVKTKDGAVYLAERVIITAGGFSNTGKLLPRKLSMNVYGRTVALLEVSASEAKRLANMPTLILEDEDIDGEPYLLPPIKYPDGKYYAKIGGDPYNLNLKDESDIKEWFRKGGGTEAFEHLLEVYRKVVPGVAFTNTKMDACITAYTTTGFPYIGETEEKGLFVATGGCGAGAKCSDEIGNLAAAMLMKDKQSYSDYATDFHIEYADQAETPNRQRR